MIAEIADDVVLEGGYSKQTGCWLITKLSKSNLRGEKQSPTSAREYRGCRSVVRCWRLGQW